MQLLIFRNSFYNIYRRKYSSKPKDGSGSLRNGIKTFWTLSLDSSTWNTHWSTKSSFTSKNRTNNPQTLNMQSSKHLACHKKVKEARSMLILAHNDRFQVTTTMVSKASHFSPNRYEHKHKLCITIHKQNKYLIEHIKMI